MTVLANSLRRIWSAKNRVPCLTGRGISGSSSNLQKSLAPVGHMLEKFLDLLDLAHRTAPTIVVIVLQIFR
jgi:hypothetical protein